VFPPGSPTKIVHVLRVAPCIIHTSASLVFRDLNALISGKEYESVELQTVQLSPSCYFRFLVQILSSALYPESSVSTIAFVKQSHKAKALCVCVCVRVRAPLGDELVH
jgi:hypothetical protein